MIKSLFKPKFAFNFTSRIIPSQTISPWLAYKRFYKFSIIQGNEDASKILEEVEAKIFQTIKSRVKTNMNKIDRAATFEDLGFDSLDAMDIIISVEETLGLDIQDEEALKIRTVNDSIAIFHRYMLERFNRNKLAQKEEEKRLSVKSKKEDQMV